eukprot:s2825_g11.t1
MDHWQAPPGTSTKAACAAAGKPSSVIKLQDSIATDTTLPVLPLYVMLAPAARSLCLALSCAGLPLRTARTMGADHYLHAIRQRSVPQGVADETDPEESESSSQAEDMEIEPNDQQTAAPAVPQTITDMTEFLKDEHLACVQRGEMIDARIIQNLTLEFLRMAGDGFNEASAARCRMKISSVFRELCQSASDQNRWDTATRPILAEKDRLPICKVFILSASMSVGADSSGAAQMPSTLEPTLALSAHGNVVGVSLRREGPLQDNDGTQTSLDDISEVFSRPGTPEPFGFSHDALPGPTLLDSDNDFGFERLDGSQQRCTTDYDIVGDNSKGSDVDVAMIPDTSDDLSGRGIEWLLNLGASAANDRVLDTERLGPEPHASGPSRAAVLPGLGVDSSAWALHVETPKFFWETDPFLNVVFGQGTVQWFLT